MDIERFIKRTFLREAYYIGFLEKKYLSLPTQERYDKVSWLDLNEYNSGWFADPFFLSKEGDHIQLLVEELVYKKGRGIITLLEIDKQNGKYVLESRIPLLELSTHLSYPNIICENGKTYVYPENGRSGGLTIYELDLQAKKLINPVKIIDGHIVDTSIYKHEGRYYAIGTIHNTAGFEYTKKADVYVSDSLFGPYTHYQTISNDIPAERGAGQIYKDGTDIIRPVQKSVRSYGEAIILNKITFCEDKIIETPLSIIEPDVNRRYGRCLHTLNIMDDLCVIDGQDYINYRTSKVFGFFKSIFRT